MTETVNSLNQKIIDLKNEAMEIKSRIAETDSIIDLIPLTQELSQMLELIQETYKKVTALERMEYVKKEIKNYWVSRWDYITLHDAILEAREAGYTDLRINELKAIYNQIEQYQD